MPVFLGKQRRPRRVFPGKHATWLPGRCGRSPSKMHTARDISRCFTSLTLRVGWDKYTATGDPAAPRITCALQRNAKRIKVSKNLIVGGKEIACALPRWPPGGGQSTGYLGAEHTPWAAAVSSSNVLPSLQRSVMFRAANCCAFCGKLLRFLR